MSRETEVARIKRFSAPVRRAFVEQPEDGKSALASLLSGANASGGGGGRGGRLRIALLLTLIWVIAKEPYTSGRVARSWAELLDLPDPEGTGARAIRDTLDELEERGFVRTATADAGRPEVELLLELGTRKGYRHPDPALNEPYFRVPRSLWESGLIGKLSGRALAMYLVCLSIGGWSSREFWINGSLVASRYGLGETTRKRGLKELVDLGVLLSRTAPVELGHDAGGRTFVRNIYTINSAFRLSNGDHELSPELVEARDAALSGALDDNDEAGRPRRASADAPRAKPSTERR